MTATVTEKMPFAKYLELPGESSSSLREMIKSPLQYKHWRDHGREDSDTLRIGRAAHTATLEMQQFLREYVLYDGRRAGGEWEKFKLANEGKTILKPEQYELALACREAIHAHKVAAPLFAGKGRNELTIQWEMGEHKLRSRIDRITSDGVLVDLKTSRDVTPRAFPHSAARFGYFTQLAFYQDACRAAGLGELPVKLVVVGSSAPHDVVVYDIEYDELERGRLEYEFALSRLAECRAKDEWPGVAPNESVKLRLPDWAVAEEDEEAITFGGEAIL